MTGNDVTALKLMLEWSSDLIKYVWAKRAKGYVRVSLALIVGGVAIAAGSIVTTLVQAAYEWGAAPCSSAPFWFASAVGGAFSGLGVIIFLGLYYVDADRLAPIRPQPSVTFQSIPGWTFEALITGIGQGMNVPINFDNFSIDDLNTLVIANRIQGSDLQEVLIATKLLLPALSGIDFDVVAGKSSFTLRRK